MKQPRSITLSSDKVKLEPLSMDHLPSFYQAAKDPQLWTWVKYHHCCDLSTTKAWLQLALDKVETGQHVAFVIIDLDSGQLVGSTRYCSIDLENSGIEIGFTFIDPAFQRSYINTHAKYLLLKHAFEQLGAIRVQFRAHQQNHQSRQAILRLGASFEGVIRHQRILVNGDIRDTAQFSMIDREWPLIKSQLLARGGDKLPIDYLPLIKQNPLAQIMLVSTEPLAKKITYIPLVYDQKRGRLTGHISVQNSLMAALNDHPELVVVFSGDNGYVSPSITNELVVPTWNYQVVHLTGRLSFVADDDPELKYQLLMQQISCFEASDWKLQPSVTTDAMLKHIRCFEISIIDACHRFKLSQNKSNDTIMAIAQHFESVGQLQFANDHRGEII